MNVLTELLCSKARAEIFRLLFTGRGVELHNRAIERRSGVCESAVRRALGRLASRELLTRRNDGNRVYYSANAAHPLHPEICSLVLKTVGLVDVLRGALADKGISIAFVFGSVARGEAKAESDIDLMLIGDLGLRRLSAMLTGVRESLGREINPHILAAAEYRKRRKAKDHFLTSVLKSPKLFVIGGEDELAAME